MAELKTKPTGQTVASFLASIKDEGSRADCLALSKIMAEATRSKPKMWGSSIVGFGSYHYRYATGREGDWFTTGFSPRKQDLTLYVMGGYNGYANLLKKLGKHSLGKGCLYLRSLDEVHLPTLKKLIQQSVRDAPKYQEQAKKLRGGAA
jgi:hypothetical protein